MGLTGICQLWLAECVPELVKSSSLRRKTKHAVWHFLLEVLSRQAVPPLFVADVYIHRKADGTYSCRYEYTCVCGAACTPLAVQKQFCQQRFIRNRAQDLTSPL